VFENIFGKREDFMPFRNTKVEYFGEAFEGFKGQGAVEKLLEEKRGYVPAAFCNLVIGDIDLIWGNNKGGLSHIIKQRTKEGIDIEKFLAGITDLIENGDTKMGDRGRWIIIKDGKKGIVSQDYFGEEAHYVVSAMETADK
jgi:hypothetical protein